MSNEVFSRMYFGKIVYTTMTVIKSLASALCSYLSAILKVQVLVENDMVTVHGK